MTVGEVLAGAARWHVEQGDCLDVLRALPDASVDAVVTDPPYELGFMGKSWDASGIAYRVDLWREVLRVLKPGGHLLAFGGTRTYHRMTCAIEDAGMEIRDSIHWLFGSGFPKSHNIGDGRGTALKPAHEPCVLARKPLVGTVAANVAEYGTGAINVDACRVGTAADVPSVRAVRAADESRMNYGDGLRRAGSVVDWTPTAGRWPANVVLSHLPECREVGTKRVRGTNVQGTDRGSALGRMNDDAWRARERKIHHHGNADGTEDVPAFDCAPGCAVAALDEQSAARGMHSAGSAAPAREQWGGSNGYHGNIGTVGGARVGDVEHGNAASRFYYVAKASRAERNAGCEGLPEREASEVHGYTTLPDARMDHEQRRLPRANHHPTVKPLALLRWLARLVTPPGGVVLDPFTGSGSTGAACALEGFRFVGVEREPEYVEIARARIAHWEAQATAPAKPKRAPKLRPVPTPPPSAPRPADERQIDLFDRRTA